MTKEEVKEIAYLAWKGAANAHRLYPDNKHTFTEYWSGAEDQFSIYSNDEELPLDKVTRLEVINHRGDNSGRFFTHWEKDNKIEGSLQDDGRTLKIFITKR